MTILIKRNFNKYSHSLIYTVNAKCENWKTVKKEVTKTSKHCCITFCSIKELPRKSKQGVETTDFDVCIKLISVSLLWIIKILVWTLLCTESLKIKDSPTGAIFWQKYKLKKLSRSLLSIYSWSSTIDKGYRNQYNLKVGNSFHFTKPRFLKHKLNTVKKRWCLDIPKSWFRYVLFIY